MLIETGSDVKPADSGSDKLAAFRLQVHQAEVKPKMSEKASARLREINEHDRAVKFANSKFVEWFDIQNVTIEFLMDLIFRIASGVADIRKRAIKCAHMLQRRRHVTISEPH